MSSLRLGIGLMCLLVGVGAAGCRAAQVYRLNPGVEPEQFRVLCERSFAECRRDAKATCADFRVLSQSSNKPEQKQVESTGVSSTGPSQGLVGWRGEMVIQCGEALRPIRLVRPETSTPAPSQSAQPSASGPARVCVPGVTQACLGPGACAGAQACIEDGTAFGPCDCGPNQPQAPVAEPSPSISAPASTSAPANTSAPAVPTSPGL